jgi:hypothetical protein
MATPQTGKDAFLPYMGFIHNLENGIWIMGYMGNRRKAPPGPPDPLM